jgi:hypothetical protein
MKAKESVMKSHRMRWSLLLLACLMMVACHDRRDPVKPTVAPAAATVAVTA